MRRGIPNSDRHDLQWLFSSPSRGVFCLCSRAGTGLRTQSFRDLCRRRQHRPWHSKVDRRGGGGRPQFRNLTQAGRSFSTEYKVFCFTLWDFRDSITTRAKIYPLVGLAAEGPIGENFIEEGGDDLKAEERVDLNLEGPGISNLISFE